MHTGDGLITKAKRDRAELQNCYMPLLTNEVVCTYPNIGSGKTWEKLQEEFCLLLWQECCKGLLNENMKDAEKALKDAQVRFRSFEDATKVKLSLLWLSLWLQLRIQRLSLRWISLWLQLPIQRLSGSLRRLSLRLL